MKKTGLFAIFVVSAALWGTGKDQAGPTGWKGTVAVENGIKVVRNPVEPLYGEFTFDLQEELSIGGDPVKVDSYFPRGASLSVDGSGNLFVTDIGNARVLMYDGPGKFIRSIGRQGQGPGEYSFPSAVLIDSENRPCVLAPRELVRFGRDGSFLHKTPIKTFLYGACFGPEDTIIGTTQPGPGPGGPKHKLLQIGADGNVLRTIAEYRGEFKEYQVAIILHAYSNRLAFAPLTPGTFVYGFSDEYRLNVADAGGRTVLAMTVNEKPLTISGREKEETKKNGVRAWLGTNDNTLRDNDFPEHRPFFVRLFTDDIGRIYVARSKSIFEKNAPSAIDVFSKDGYCLYRMAWQKFPSAIKGGFLYEVRTDEDSGEYFVVRYKIRNWSAMKTG
jgi:hypothetical protein